MAHLDAVGTVSRPGNVLEAVPDITPRAARHALGANAQESLDTFEDYCRERWDLGESHANRQITAARVVDVVTLITLPTPGQRRDSPAAGSKAGVSTALSVLEAARVVEVITAPGRAFELEATDQTTDQIDGHWLRVR